MSANQEQTVIPPNILITPTTFIQLPDSPNIENSAIVAAAEIIEDDDNFDESNLKPVDNLSLSDDEESEEYSSDEDEEEIKKRKKQEKNIAIERHKSLKIEPNSPNILERLKNHERKIIVAQRIVKKWLARRELKNLEIQKKKIQHRNEVANEILQSERNYVNSLKVLINVFLKPMREAVLLGKPILSHEALSCIFSCVEVIININSELLKEIESKMTRWNNTQKLGDVFIKLGPFLKTYTDYSKNYEKAIKTVSANRKTNDRFRALTDGALSLPETQNLDITSFLIMPVQRIPRYILLLGVFQIKKKDFYYSFT
jgi:hypothetical protein